MPGVGEQIEIQMLADLSVEFRRTTAEFPISTVYLAVEDFTGREGEQVMDVPDVLSFPYKFANFLNNFGFLGKI